MTIPILVGTAAGVIADVAILAFGARRLLNTRFSAVRVVLAGVVGLLVANAVIAALLAGGCPYLFRQVVVVGAV